MFGLGLYILAWLIIWNFLIHATAARFSDSPAAQGISSLI